MDAHVLGWLLRPWSEPLFLRLALAEVPACGRDLAPAESAPAPLCQPLFAFDQLEATAICPDDEARHQARTILTDDCSFDRPTIVGAMAGLLRYLRGLKGNDRKLLLDIARSRSLPELFDGAGMHPPAPERLTGYHELHAHFRGSVPFPYLFSSWLRDHRYRASLRTVTSVAPAGSARSLTLRRCSRSSNPD